MSGSSGFALLTVAIVAAIAAIIADQRHLTTQRYLFKPLPVLLMLLAVFSATQVSMSVRLFFGLALIASAAGDLLLIDRRRFVYGLGAFLGAHILYVAGIWISLPDDPRLISMLPLTLWGGVLFWILRDELAELELPVLVYISIILVMIWLAIEYHHQFGDKGSALLLGGAIVFGLSDTILAIDHFKKPFFASKALILITYYLAQFSIAFSLIYRGVSS